MEREKLIFKSEEEAKNVLIFEESEEFTLIEDKQTYYDTEKGYTDYEVIIQRNSDKKYFKGTYTKWPAGGRQIDKTIYEVFPRQIIKIVYE